MKRNRLTLITGIAVVVIFSMMLFFFQVRQTEVAVVTTLGSYSGSKSRPGLYARLPWPIQNIHRFDNRIRNFEKKYEQTTTRDGRILLVDVFLGWRIADPKVFLERFGGDVIACEQNLEGLMRDAKNGVLGQHFMADLISTDAKVFKFDQIEQEMLITIQLRAKANYGIEVDFLGIKQIGLPESITAKVFERMKAEREQLVKQFKGDGDAEAIRIRSDADRERERILAEAGAQATVIQGQADAEAAKTLKTFQQNPELAIFLLKLKALEEALKDRATVILDPRTPPFDLLRGEGQLPADHH